MIKKYLSLIRVHHYIKNILIFLPLVFSGNLFNTDSFILTILGFIAFCLASSTVYIFNDIFDADKDKLHPTKRRRPIASGKISKKTAFVICVFFLIATLLLNWYITSNKTCLILIGIYLMLNLAYSLGLKQIPLIDITILVAGYLIRVLYGSALTQIPVSNLLYLTIISLSFYLGLGKRRNELARQGAASRKVLKYYSFEFLDKNMYVSNALTIAFYAMWCTSLEITERFSNMLVWTVPLILLMSMKYSLNIERNFDGDPVEVILKDKILLMLTTIYILIVLLIIYWPLLLK